MLGRRVVCAVLFLACRAVAEASGEAGSPLIRNFNPKLYHASPQNWSITQDRRGVLYFANNDCVLEHDGVSWRRIAIPGGTVVRSVAADNEHVYVGAQGEFGYLGRDELGNSVYHSLTSLVAKEARAFNDVWSIIPTRQGVYFGTYQGIYRWTPDNHISVLKPDTRFGRLVGVQDEVFVVSAGRGLLHLRPDGLDPVPGGEHLTPQNVRSMFDRGAGLELVTDTGLFHLADGSLRAAPLQRGLLSGGNAIYTAAPLWNGSLALGTRLGGVVVVSGDGTVERLIAKENGLQGNGITSLYADREGGLWITSASGIDRADLAMTRFAQGEGLSGATYSVTRYGGALYAGTFQGLYLLDHSQGIPAFLPVEGGNSTVVAAVPSAHGLLVGTQTGLLQVLGSRVRPITEKQLVYDIALSSHGSDLAWTANRTGLEELRWKGSAWSIARTLPSAGEDFRAVLEDNDGRLWVATQKDILRVDWRGDNEKVERFGLEAGVPAGFKNIFRIRGQILFATPGGLQRFEPATSRFVPYTGLGKEFADGSHPVSTVRESPDGSIWITGEGYHGLLTPVTKDTYSWRAMPLGRADLAELYAVMPEADGTVWAAGIDGFLVRYSPKEQPPPAPFEVLVRRVQSAAGLTAYNGAGELSAAPAIGYSNNSLRFEYAAPYMEDPGKVEYQVKLEGADEDWSAWSVETRKDYTHLFEGSYLFIVRARTPSGTLSAPASFRFSIRPPWYRTWPAWVAYAVLLAACVWSLVKWRVSALEADKARLEQTVEERTVEIRQQRDQIALEEERSQKLLLNILPASVADELKQTGEVQPQQYDEVTICFTDFVGFTLSSESLPADQLVSALHEYFTAFDRIVGEFGLEKLKTIGDAYMLVSGLPKPRRSHAVDAVLAALRMVEAVDALAERGANPVWNVRVGLHSGPVAAGVVGVRKFAYDIWGNSVNLASRMESSGLAGRVNLSEATCQAVSEFIECEARGEVRTKDKRELSMYFAVGIRPELSEPGAFEQLYFERFGEKPGYQIPVGQKVVI